MPAPPKSNNQINFLRRLLWQIGFLAVIALIGYSMIRVAVENMRSQGIASGFDFLQEKAGFDLLFSFMPFDATASYLDAFYAALVNTLFISFLGILAATGIGFVVALGRLSQNPLLRWVCRWYVEIIRNLPLLLQIFFWYFAVLRTLPHPRGSLSFFESIFINNRGIYLPVINGRFPGHMWIVLALLAYFLSVAVIKIIQLSKANLHTVERKRPVSHAIFGFLNIVFALAGVGLIAMGKWSYPELTGFNFQGGTVLIPEMLAILAALSMYTGAFISEIVRSGIESVDKGQIEAADSLGLNYAQKTRIIVLPQAMRVIIPPLTSQYLNLFKNSSLSAAIAYPDLVLVFAGTVLNQTGQAIEILLMTMGVYLSVSLGISYLMNLYNKKFNFA